MGHLQAGIGLLVGAVLNCYNIRKHTQCQIGESSSAYWRAAQHIAAGAALDDVYVIRTALGANDLSVAD